MANSRAWRWEILLLLFLSAGPILCSQGYVQDRDSQKAAVGDSLELHLGNGYEALRQERYEEAEKEFRAALTMDPSLVMRAQFPLAVALFEQHKTAAARREFEAVRHAEGDRPGILYYLGRLDLDEHNFTEAAENLGKANSHPPFPDTPFYLGLAYLNLGSDQEAEQWLKKATELNPGESRAEYELAKLYRKQGREEDARQAFERSKEMKTQSDKLSQLKWACGQELDRGPSDQAPSCDELYDPTNAELLTALGVLYGQHGQLEKAVRPLERAVELAPQSPQTLYNLAFTYYQLKRFADARGPLQTAVGRWPDLFPLTALYGAILFNLGEMPAAYQVLHHAHQLNPQDAGATALLYQSALELAQRAEQNSGSAEALRYLREAAALAPGDPEPHRRMAAIYRRIGQIPKADQEEQRAAELRKSSKD
jgi:tetratricopeptide (TPR) repeat protein